ncbi:MAG: phospholipase D-like domain-containing protein [Desulfobacteraceae bacterium]|jgi:phosphatidylserine/phosphatidylglycerophosphate/cardiolipin synthase-like enzyme
MTFYSEIQLLSGHHLHQNVIQEAVFSAEQYVWIATANLKDMHIPVARRYKPILEIFDQMAARGVLFRIVHADLPSQPFRTTLERFPRLTSNALELQICPRCHWKMVIVDGAFAYLGSANFTGAGLGAKSENSRNLEVGITSKDSKLVRKIEALFDIFWIGSYCIECTLRADCPDPIGQD